MASDDTRRYSPDDLLAMRDRRDTGITADATPIEPDEEFWRSACIAMPTGKASIHLRVDRDVLDWFKAEGKGHLTRMNAVLRSYVEARKREAR